MAEGPLSTEEQGVGRAGSPPSGRPGRGAPAGSPQAGASSVAGLASLAVLAAAYLLIDLVAGAPRSPLVPPLPAGARRPGWAVAGARAIGLDRLGPAPLSALAVALLMAAVAAFLLALREARRGRLRLRAAGLAAGAALALAAAGPLILSRDVSSYAIYGRIAAVHHANPYRLPPSAFPADPFAPVVSREWRRTTSVYGPASTIVGAAIARVWRDSPGGTVAGFKVLAAMAAAGATVLGGAAARSAAAPPHGGRWTGDTTSGRGGGSGDPAVLAVVLIGLNPVVVVHTVGGGHNDALVLAAMAGAVLLALPLAGRHGRGPAGPGPADEGDPSGGGDSTGPPAPSDLGPRSLAVTLLLVLATLVKVVAAIPLGLWLLSVATRPGRDARTRARAGAGHVALVVAVTAVTLLPTFTGRASLTAITGLASRQGYASAARMAARVAGAAARALGGPAAVRPAARATYAAFLALFAGAVLLLLARRRGRTRPEEWGVALLLFALAAPYLLPWYAAWFVPFLALPGRRDVWPAGVALCAALALTGVPAEPGMAPSLWSASMFAVHWVAAPFVLVLLGLTLHRSLRRPPAERDQEATRERGPAAPP